MSGDITIVWDNVDGTGGDWGFQNGDLQTGDDIETSVIISLFTDARLPDDLPVPDGSQNRKGWWGSTYTPYPLGSLLWTLYRAKIASQTTLLLHAKNYCTSALAWMIAAGIVQSVNVQTFWITSNNLGIVVRVVEPNQNATTTFNYSYAWGSVKALPRSLPIPAYNSAYVSNLTTTYMPIIF